MEAAAKIRIDKYLWAIRIFKTRSQATDACEQGKVKAEGLSLKASRPVRVGDRFEIRTPDRRWVIQVQGLIDRRVAFAQAIQFYIDQTPEEELQRLRFQAESFHTGKRMSKIGRPTKKQRRNLEGFWEEDVPE